MEYKRKIFPEEVALIAFLASKAQFQLESNWENKFIAYPLTKEKIGSIGLFKNNQKYTRRQSRVLSCCKFHDVDNVEVAVLSLIDSNDTLYELDFWKVDDSEILPYSFRRLYGGYPADIIRHEMNLT